MNVSARPPKIFGSYPNLLSKLGFNNLEMQVTLTTRSTAPFPDLAGQAAQAKKTKDAGEGGQKDADNAEENQRNNGVREEDCKSD
jgi:hypothetical protein